jgi:hypothetical protein
VPEGHRFEATQALPQVLNRAVEWGLIDANPAKRGIRNSPVPTRKKLPFEGVQRWRQVRGCANPRRSPAGAKSARRFASAGRACDRLA